MGGRELQRLKELFYAALLIEGIPLKEWCEKRNFSYGTLKSWLYRGFPKGKERKSRKGQQVLQEILATIDEVGLSDKVNPLWRSYYD